MIHSSSETMKHKLLTDFNAVMSEADRLLKLVTEDGGDKANALRAKVEKNLLAWLCLPCTNLQAVQPSKKGESK